MTIQSEIAERYYQTTASRSHRREKTYYANTAKYTRRLLGAWRPTTENTRCLDLACGCGELLYMLQEDGISTLTGVDLCQEELDEARLFVNARFEKADVLDFLQREPANSYDFVSAMNVLEHLPKDILPEVLRQCRRVLAPGGFFLAQVPNGLSPFSGTTRYWDITHITAFVPNNFRQLAALSGFSPEVDFAECRPIFHGLKSGLRAVAWQTLRGLIASWLLIETGSTKDRVYSMDMLVRMKT